MKLLINCINLILGYTFNTIGLIYPIRDVYISSLIQPEQILYIQNSIAKFNLTRTYDKSENHIRIQYDNDIIANTKMSATLYQIGSFVVENTVISFNPNIYENVLGCVILHELGHSVGLSHNNISSSIMNYTLYINEYGYILNNNDECPLSDDDNLGIEYNNKL
jgi:hypothetical protein